MADRPILFSGPMVRAILGGRKTQTRRLFKPAPPDWVNHCEEVQRFNMRQEWVPAGLWWWTETDASGQLALRRWPVDEYGQRYAIKPAFAKGDRLWVRETWCWAALGGYDARDDGGEVWYRASDDGECDGAWKPSIHMPRRCSRLTLIVTDVRVERLQDIGEADAIAEGAGQYSSTTKLHRDRPYDPSLNGHYREGFSELWEGLNAKRGFGWDANPWVVAVTFDAVKANIDTLPAEASDGIAAARPLGIGQREAGHG